LSWDECRRSLKFGLILERAERQLGPKQPQAKPTEVLAMRPFTFSIAILMAWAISACVPTTQPTHRMTGGGGGGYVDQWSSSPLVDDDGNVNVDPNEEVTDHPSTDPNDSGFEGDGPPSIDS